MTQPEFVHLPGPLCIDTPVTLKETASVYSDGRFCLARSDVFMELVLPEDCMADSSLDSRLFDVKTLVLAARCVLRD